MSSPGEPEFVADQTVSATKKRGVYRQSWGTTWFAQVRRDGKLHYLGTFSTEDEAAEAVQAFSEEER